MTDRGWRCRARRRDDDLGDRDHRREGWRWQWGWRYTFRVDRERDRGFARCALHDPLTLATVIAPDLLTMKEYYVDGAHSGGVAMGKTLADLVFRVTKKPANMKVAMDVRGDDFIELFVHRMETLARSIPE